jgi:DNA-binding GntR family transcriptional regulator
MSLFPPTPPFQTKEAYAYGILRESILSGQFAPGDRLVMDRLSKEMGISPIPLRAALQRLESEGLVEITPHSGAVVAAISRTEIGEIFLLLEALEGPAFREAARLAQPQDRDVLRALVDEMEDALAAADLEAWAAANDRFHRAVAALSGMRLLPELTGRVLDQWARLRRSFAPVLAARVSQAQADHRQMLDLLEKGDGDQLSTLAADHNRRARLAYEQQE